MRKLSKREKNILTITIGLIVIFIFMQWVIKPLAAGNIDEQLRLARARLIKTQMIIAMKNQVKESWQHWMDLFALKQPQDAQMAAMVSKIESAARQSNVHIVNIQPQAPRSAKVVRFFPVELDIDGAWVDLVKFIYLLQQPPNYYFIDELNLEKYSDAASALRGRVLVSCMRSAYRV